jgi:hypothetical protein
MRRALLNMSLLLAVSASTASAQTRGPWDGVWTGLLRNNAGVVLPISITIGKDKVLSFTLQGEPFAVQYSRISAGEALFGDRNNYSVELKKTGAGVEAWLRGRHGYEVASLARQ